MSAIADKRRGYADGVAGIALLEERWPRAFFVPEHRRKPLKVGIRQDIVAAGLGDLTPGQLSNALRVYCRNRRYLERLRPNAARVDLNGEFAGYVNAVDAKRATEDLARRFLKVAARRQAVAAAPVHSSPAPMSERPKRLGLADLRQLARERAREQRNELQNSPRQSHQGCAGNSDT
jgi:sRNA-binding protein